MTTPPPTPSAAEPTEPLWDDERIRSRAKLIRRTGISEANSYFVVAKEILDDMQKRIDELEAENRELSRMVSLEFEQAMKGSKND